jgi:hypothetical protein
VIIEYVALRHITYYLAGANCLSPNISDFRFAQSLLSAGFAFVPITLLF